jgi:hypothetical protein
MGKHPPRGYAASSAPRSSLALSKMRAVLVMVGDLLGKQVLQMPLVQCNHMVRAARVGSFPPSARQHHSARDFRTRSTRRLSSGIEWLPGPVLRIPVIDQKSRSRAKRKCLPQLQDDPTAGWMFRDVDVQDTAAIMADDKETVEHSECDRGHCEEIHGRNRFPVIRKKWPPTFDGLGSLGARFIQRVMVLSDTPKPNMRSSP